MSAGTLFNHIVESVHGAGSIVKQGIRILLKQPHILIYPYLAVTVVLLTSPLVSKIVIPLWHKVEQPPVLNEVSRNASETWLSHFGLVTFSVFYAIFVTSFFVCAISATTLAKLEHHNPSALYGLRVVYKNFFRVAKFSLLAIFFLPLGIISQRRKMDTPRGVFEAVSSSFSLSMTQLAPAIVKGHSGVSSTIRHSVDVIGHFWKESLVIRGATLLALIILGSISFLPKLIQHYWFDSHSAHVVGWIATVLLGVSSYVVLHVISAVFTTTLYHRAELERNRSK